MRYLLDEPTTNLSEPDPHHHWLRGTDVQHHWRKHGWVPPSEYRLDFKRHAALAHQAKDRQS